MAKWGVSGAQIRFPKAPTPAAFVYPSVRTVTQTRAKHLSSGPRPGLGPPHYATIDVALANLMRSCCLLACVNCTEGSCFFVVVHYPK